MKTVKEIMEQETKTIPVVKKITKIEKKWSDNLSKFDKVQDEKQKIWGNDNDQ